MLLCRFPLDVTGTTPNGKKIRLTVSMYRKSVDSAYKQLIMEKVTTGAFDEYLVAMLENILSQGME